MAKITVPYFNSSYWFIFPLRKGILKSYRQSHRRSFYRDIIKTDIILTVQNEKEIITYQQFAFLVTVKSQKKSILFIYYIIYLFLRNGIFYHNACH